MKRAVLPENLAPICLREVTLVYFQTCQLTNLIGVIHLTQASRQGCVIQPNVLELEGLEAGLPGGNRFPHLVNHRLLRPKAIEKARKGADLAVDEDQFLDENIFGQMKSQAIDYIRAIGELT